MNRCLGLLSCLWAVALGCAGCSDSAPANRAVAERDIIVPAGSVDELLALIDEHRQAASHMIDAADRDPRLSVDLNKLRTHVFTGVKAADRVLDEQAEALDPARRADVHRAKLELLRLANRRRLVPGARLRRYVERLAETHPDTDLAAEAEAAWLWDERLSRVSWAEAEELLDEFATKHPNRPATVRLFARYTERRLAAGEEAEAMASYQSAVEQLGDPADLQSLRDQLQKAVARRQAESTRHAAAAMAARQEKAQRLARLKAILGGHESGYFVIYANEKPDRDKPGMIHFVRYEHVVCHGLEQADQFIKGLPGNWEWKLKGHFPETPAGAAQAHALRNRK